MIKVLGKPDGIDTLRTAQLKSLNDYTMATLNRYSGGLLLLQGKKTERINRMHVFLNPVASKKYLDYVNTPFRGKLTLLGLKIDSNTTIRQVEKAMARYEPYLAEEYQTMNFYVYDPKTRGRLMEVWIHYLKDSEKIEYIRLSLFPAPALKKGLIEFKGGQFYLDALKLDTAAGKIAQLKKVLGEPNAIFETPYRGLNGHTYKARRHLYDYISGITLIENPFNQSLLAIQLDFLSIRSENTLSNPVFNLVINGKKFDPENAVPKGPDDASLHYSLDSVSKTVVESESKTIVTSTNRYGRLDFEFAGKYIWEKRVYHLAYHLNTLLSQGEIASDPVSTPSVVAKDGMLIMKTNKNSAYWTGSVNSPEAFIEVMGKPTTTTAEGVSVFPSVGVRMWTKGGKLDAIQYYLEKYINAYSGNNDAPGIYTGTIEVEGRSLTKESTLDQLMAALSAYNLQKAYDDKNHSVYKGTYKGLTMYLTFGITNKKLITVSFNRK